MRFLSAKVAVVVLHLLTAALLFSVPLSAQTILDFPRVVSSADVFTGLAVVS